MKYLVTIVDDVFITAEIEAETRDNMAKEAARIVTDIARDEFANKQAGEIRLTSVSEGDQTKLLVSLTFSSEWT